MNYIDNRTNKKYKCTDCGKVISTFSGVYGQSRCGHCAQIIESKKKDITGSKNPTFKKEVRLKISESCKGRIISQETLQKIREALRGSKHWNWQGGKSSLGQRIRNLFEYSDWRKIIFKRDNYTCLKCGKKSKGDIEAHHKKEFHIILVEFLKEYDQFSPIEDKETLVRLAIKYKPFWDITNGKTLCKDCHKLTDNYKNKHV